MHDLIFARHRRRKRRRKHPWRQVQRHYAAKTEEEEWRSRRAGNAVEVYDTW
jgi:hypothetical protein